MTRQRLTLGAHELSLTTALELLLGVGAVLVAWRVVGTPAGARRVHVGVLVLTGRQWYLVDHTVLLETLVGSCTTMASTLLGCLRATTETSWTRLLVLLVSVFLPRSLAMPVLPGRLVLAEAQAQRSACHRNMRGLHRDRRWPRSPDRHGAHDRTCTDGFPLSRREHPV